VLLPPGTLRTLAAHAIEDWDPLKLVNGGVSRAQYAGWHGMGLVL
jgi:hypothetical protein